MKTVMVLGVNGYLGANICQALKILGCRVIGVGRTASTSQNVDQYIMADLSKLSSIEVLCNINCDLVIDLISFILPNDKRSGIKDVREALFSYRYLLESYFSTKKYIFVSSGGTIYGNCKFPCKESDELKPLSAYGIQKAFQEEMIQNVCSNFTILRVANPYGRDQKVKNGVGFVSYAIGCSINERDIVLTVPQETVRDYIFVDDLVDAIVTLIYESESEKEVYNISTGVGTSLFNICQRVISSSGKGVITKVDLTGFNNDSHIMANVLDNKKIVRKIKKDIPQGLLEFIDTRLRLN